MKKWESIAIDYYSPFWRNYNWVYAITLQPKLVDISQVYLGIKSDNQKMFYIDIPQTWEKANRQLARMIDKNIGVLENILNQTFKIGAVMNAYTLVLTEDNLSLYSSDKILTIYKKYFDYNALEYAWGVTLPILDFHTSHYVEDKLRSILGKWLKQEEAAKAFGVFTQPTEDSFALEQEKSLLKIYQHFSKHLLSRRTEVVLAELRKNHPQIYRRLKKHAQKYAWVFYVFSGPAMGERDFIETMKFYAKKKINPARQLKKLAKERLELLKKRKSYFAKLNLSEREKRFVEIASRFIYFKPRRKDWQSKSYYHLEFLQKEIGRRLGLSLAQVRSMTLEEVERGLSGKIINVDKINERMRFHIIVLVGKKVRIYQGKEAIKFDRQNIKKERIKRGALSEIFGQSACPGKVKGIVKIVNTIEDMKEMSDGDVLLSAATSPRIISAIRKAAAIVTDEGGLTCHAAIISREFNIPCVIGTGMATKVLKDGDRVEVDATKGIVKKI
ncbi:hypothetical protein A2773_05995 [Candidatus Gottesmanbacteria bacterium RIFCSPHIGHO2_01_FULL_39_10]|uniref:PEP-utilising enzyme mobile domain-containing protein n=1 Tax=Candidatus Gottesmanbacteria bacterium RIFCSPHIGHO2_01_FULL_39_10 TaxID=1798375 RepID=A0A1F5ZPV4_9BACT|nr:MAG: hypothetical protein A2773_05995 [Candidatus Gottesmanbacteria bacterium RIFCSPHIGHO2_01_FULL_39_10]